MKARHLLTATACAASLLTIPACAQNMYVELDAGRSRISADCAGTSQCDRSGTFARAAVGYQLTPTWAVELALADLGRFSAGAVLPGIGSVQASGRVRSAGIGVAGSWPLGQTLSLTGRLGVAANRTSTSGSAAGVSVSDSERNTAPLFGVGMDYAFSSATSVGLMLERHQAEFQGDKSAIVVLGLGLKFRF